MKSTVLGAFLQAAPEQGFRTFNTLYRFFFLEWWVFTRTLIYRALGHEPSNHPFPHWPNRYRYVISLPNHDYWGTLLWVVISDCTTAANRNTSLPLYWKRDRVLKIDILTEKYKIQISNLNIYLANWLLHVFERIDLEGIRQLVK